MYYVYVLKHPTEDRIYIGFTTDLRSWVKMHKTEHPQWGVWLITKLMLSETDARARERRLKHYGNVQQLLKKRIMRSLLDGLK